MIGWLDEAKPASNWDKYPSDIDNAGIETQTWRKRYRLSAIYTTREPIAYQAKLKSIWSQGKNISLKKQMYSPYGELEP